NVSGLFNSEKLCKYPFLVAKLTIIIPMTREAISPIVAVVIIISCEIFQYGSSRDFNKLPIKPAVPCPPVKPETNSRPNVEYKTRFFVNKDRVRCEINPKNP